MAEDKKKYTLRGKDIEDKSAYYYTTPEYKPSSKAQTVIKNTWERYTDIRNNRDLNYRWFGKRRDGTYRTLINYIDLCEKRWNSDGIPRINLEDWQASVFKPETRNKVMAILSAVAQQRPRNNFKGREKSDYLREMVTRDLYDWSEDMDDGDEMALYTMLDAIIHGTAIRYEGYEDCKKVIKEIEPGSDLYDIKFKEKTVVIKKVITKEVRLQDFYFGSMMTRRMDEQPDCVWRKLMRINDFKREFGGWEESKFVLPGGDLTDETYFSSFVSEEIREKDSELVEVIRYYSKETDEFIILANGVWVNPMGKNKVSPLPFHHKELPFFSVIFEPFSSTFPYGKALPDKMLHEQDAINALYNMMLDQSYVSIHKPLVTGDEDVLDDVELVPGKVNYIGADVANIQELQISPPATAHFNMLQLMMNSVEQSSVDSVQQGDASDAKTATAVRQAAAAASRQFLLFLEFVFHGYKRKARLRVKNILQFLTTPTILEKVMGDDGEERFNEAFQSFKLDDVSLSTGKQGTRIIELVSDRDTLLEKFNNREKERKELEPQNVEKIYLTPEYIREFDFDVKPIPGSTIKETEEVSQALEIQFQSQAMTLFPDMINREALFDDFLEVFKKDKQRLKIQPMMNPINPQMMPQGQGQGQGGIANQIVNRATGNRQLTPNPSLNQLTR